MNLESGVISPLRDPPLLATMSNTGQASPTSLHPDIVVRFLRRLGVTTETTKAIRDDIERKRAEDEEEKLEREARDGEHDVDGGYMSADKRRFAARNGVDAAACDGDRVMMQDILGGEPAKVRSA